jgi:HD-GYP domain-containing protein (c-di-GMP phosphodiesterase class II)
VTGAIVISKLGIDQFDEDDIRLLEVLSGQASVALENARLYEQQRREAEGAKALLAFTAELQHAQSFEDIYARTVETAVALFETPQASLWLGETCVASIGEPISAGAAAPLAGGDGPEGRIVIGTAELDEDRERLLAALASHAAVALEKSRLYSKQLEAAEVASALLDASRELASAESSDELLARSVEVTARVLGTPKVALFVEDDAHPGTLAVRASLGYGEQVVIGLELPSGALERAEPFTHDTDDARIVVAPIRLERNRFAALSVTVGNRELDERRLRLLAGLAHQAKVAIESAEHVESLERTFVSTVEALANALEASDEYTSSHARWITDVALLVGRSLQLDRETMKRLELGALFHDIGKIGIPSEVLRRPGPLNDAEFELVKEHPVLGEKILAPIERLADVRPIVRSCHERWDGRGYPDGKRGEEIPLESRIVFVCDAFHAMTTDRPYRKRLSQVEAIGRLREGAGTQFDPAVVETFAQLYEAGEVVLLD